jgi:hypothetical protein
MRCQACKGTGSRKVELDIFLLGDPPCSACYGRGHDPEAVCRRVRELRADHHTYRSIAAIIHQEAGGKWEPPDNQLEGEALCSAAGIDHNDEFQAWLDEKSHQS